MPPARRSPVHLALQRILIERRAAAGLSQAALAERIGRPQSFIAKIEGGERRLDVPELLELAAALGCQAEDIVAELGLATEVATVNRHAVTKTKAGTGGDKKPG